MSLTERMIEDLKIWMDVMWRSRSKHRVEEFWYLPSSDRYAGSVVGLKLADGRVFKHTLPIQSTIRDIQAWFDVLSAELTQPRR